MPRQPRFVPSCLVLLASLVLGLGVADAATIPITWINYAPTPVGGVIPNASVYNVTGIGNVLVTYSLTTLLDEARTQFAPATVGSVPFGPDTYTWSNYEYFGTIYNDTPLGPAPGKVTFIFPTTLPAGTVFVGTLGIGATTSFGGGQSSFTVNQNGTFFGDFIIDPTFGATAFAGGPGTFTMTNSVTGAGGSNPWWNTQLGIVRIDDPVSSVTVDQACLRGDGIGFNIGFAVDKATPTQSTTWGRLKSLYH